MTAPAGRRQKEDSMNPKNDVKDVVRPILQRAITEQRDRRLSVNDLVLQVIGIDDVRMALLHTGMVAVLEELILEDWARFANIGIAERQGEP
jgi:hypothetical protein